ncbi:very short patch repair endonuclease [Neobacillus bataviensis]|nr:very short patch repair endonuclease [Neobacillus bataviensis]
MTDIFSKEQRSRNMKAIRSKGTSLENIVGKELWKKGIRFRKNVRKLKGNPDIAIQKYKIVIFLDSCFWHTCPLHGKKPSSNLEYWEKKLKRNIERDNEVTAFYQQKGWNIMRVWEHEVKNDLHGTIEKIANFIQSCKNA